MANRYIKNPYEIVSVGDVVTVWVLSVDHGRRRVSLSMIKPGTERRQLERKPQQPRQQQDQQQQPPRGNRPQRGRRPPPAGQAPAAQQGRQPVSNAPQEGTQQATPVTPSRRPPPPQRPPA